MTLTKAGLADSIYNKLGFSGTKSARLIETIIETMKQTLESGENIMISGFGKFSVSNKSERRMKNLTTGEDLMLEARRVVTFKCSPLLKNKINEKG
jgi:integration host factor subunit alpha